MIDIHCHVLPAVDDGASSWDVTLAMCRLAEEDGVTDIVATPHANYDYVYDRAQHLDLLEKLRERAPKLKFSLGCDFHLSYENVRDAKDHPERYAIGDTRYLLVELSDFGLPPNLEDWFDEIQSLGLTPVIAHPERNPLLSSQIVRMAGWVAAGVLLQVTAGSLTGRFESRAESLAKDLLGENLVHLVASDAHGMKSRRPSMQRAWEFLSSRYGAEVAERLCLRTPRSIFQGEPLAALPEPKEGPQRRKQASLLGRLLSRA